MGDRGTVVSLRRLDAAVVASVTDRRRRTRRALRVRTRLAGSCNPGPNDRVIALQRGPWYKHTMDGRLLGGRYRLLEAHAMGGMASVWRAHDERTGEVVAVKRLHPHLIADEGARERFRREAAAMEAIRHPNVVAVRDAVIDEDEPALVMDFVAGRSVAELAADGHAFDEAEALAVAASVADGLASVHEAGIVHRDLKPANVLIGDDGVARLSDFGIAVGLMDATALTADDGVIGTLRYLAPERLAGSPATPATDVWGLGTVLYEMLTGVAAFPETTLAARVEAAAAPVTRPDGLIGRHVGRARALARERPWRSIPGRCGDGDRAPSTAGCSRRGRGAGRTRRRRPRSSHCPSPASIAAAPVVAEAAAKRLPSRNRFPHPCPTWRRQHPMPRPAAPPPAYAGATSGAEQAVPPRAGDGRHRRGAHAGAGGRDGRKRDTRDDPTRPPRPGPPIPPPSPRPHRRPRPRRPRCRPRNPRARERARARAETDRDASLMRRRASRRYG